MIRRPSTAADTYSAAALYTAALSLLVSSQYFHSDIVPSHDAFGKFSFYYYFFSQVLEHGSLPLWIPTVLFGVPTGFYQFWLLTPADYLTLFIGYVLSIQNVLILFKWSYLLEQLFFSLGVWLLAREIVRSPLMVVLTTATVVFCVSWTIQPFFNFYVFAGLPYAYFALIRFRKHANPTWLWLAAVFSTLSLIGNLIYVAPLHLFVIGISFLAVLCGERACLSALLRIDAYTRVSFLIFILMFAGISVIGASVLQGIDVVAPHRVSGSGESSLGVFLNYGRLPLATTVFGFLSGAMSHAPNSYYVGLLPFVGFFIGLAFCRRLAFWIFAAPAIALAWLSIGGYFAVVAYHLPGMELYRHVGLVFGIVKIFILVSAAVALDSLLEALKTRQLPVAFGPVNKVVFLVLAVIGADVAANWRGHDASIVGEITPDWEWLLVARLVSIVMAALGIAVAWRRRGAARPVLISFAVGAVAAVHLADVVIYQYTAWSNTERVSPEFDDAETLFNAAAVRLERNRQFRPDTEQAKKRLALIMRLTTHRNAKYAINMAYVNWSGCGAVPDIRVQIVSTSITTTLSSASTVPGRMLQLSESTSPDLLAQLGCGAPTISLPRYPEEIASVTSFSSNRIALSVPDAIAPNSLLTYADAHNEDWKAFVNGVEVPISKTGVGTKGVAVTGGDRIEFVFGDGLRTAVAIMIAAVGFAVGLMLLGFALWACLHGVRPILR